MENKLMELSPGGNYVETSLSPEKRLPLSALQEWFELELQALAMNELTKSLPLQEKIAFIRDGGYGSWFRNEFFPKYEGIPNERDLRSFYEKYEREFSGDEKQRRASMLKSFSGNVSHVCAAYTASPSLPKKRESLH